MNQKLSMLLLVAGTWTVVAAAGGDETSKELDKLNGTWKVVYDEDSGKKRPVDPKETLAARFQSSQCLTAVCRCDSLRKLVGVPTGGAV
jgi:hypothetical protein